MPDPRKDPQPTPCTLLPDPRVTPRYAGVCTFCRFPLLEAVDPSRLPVDWAVYGVPFDTGVTYRTGTRFGPRAVRDASQYVKPYHVVHDLMLTDVLSMADAGDSPVRTFSCEENVGAVVDFAMSLGDPKRTKLFAVGGDHSIALPNMRATWERRGKPKGGLALLHFDSHVDTVDQTLGERYSHASPFIRAIEEGVIDPKRMLSVGIKGPLNSRDELSYAKERGITLVTYEQWRIDGPRIIADFLKRLGKDEAYVSFDIDCVDPAFAPGTGTLSVGGFTSAEILAVLRSLKGVNVVGADVVEVLPERDPTGITALLASHALFEILCLDGLNRAGR